MGQALDFNVYLDDRQFASKLAASERRVMGFARNTVHSLNEVEDSFKKIGAGAAGYFAFSELSSLPKKLIDVRGEFQNLNVAFSTILGSKAKADALMAQVVEFAGKTPFNLADVASGSKQLLAYGFASEQVIGTLRRLGDISAGLKIPLGELTDLYGKTKTNGRLFAEDLNQYVGRGIPLIALLADQFKVAESDVRGLVETGKVGFPEVEKAINKLTDAGGTFAGLMAEQSKTLTGLYANFEDAVTKAFNNIGAEQEDLLGDTIKYATLAVENYEPIIDTLTVLVATVGTYKAAVIATSVAQALLARGGAIKAWLELATTIRSAKDAQVAFSLATSKNPYILAATAIIALVTAVGLFSDETNEATKAQERALEIQGKFNQTRAEEMTKVQLLSEKIKDETISREERNKKLKELIAISPQHFNALNLDNIATDKGAEAIRNYTKELEKKLKLQATEEQIVTNNKRISDIKTGVLQEEFQPSTFERAKLFLEDSGFDEKKFKQETEKRKQAAIKALEEQNVALIKVATEGDKAIVKPKATNPVPKANVAKAAKDEKDIRIKTFEEEIEEKKQLYQLYQRWVDGFGQQAADKQFADLIDQNKTYVDFLNSKIDEITSANTSGQFSTGESKNLDFVISERVEAKGGKTAIEQYSEKLAKAKEEAGSLTEYLVYLKNAQDDLSNQAPTSIGTQQIKAVTEVGISEKLTT